jgi:hypothetical protein
MERLSRQGEERWNAEISFGDFDMASDIFSEAAAPS